MSCSKYDDVASAMQVIGGIVKKPSLLDDVGRYEFKADDFTSDLHKVVFQAIGTIYANGGSSITAGAINDILAAYPESYAKYKAANGNEWFVRLEAMADVSNFDLYYRRLKKMTLLRQYDMLGIDMGWLYDPDELDQKKRQRQMDDLDKMTLREIAERVNDRISRVTEDYVDNTDRVSVDACDGIDDLIQRLRDEPDFGVPLYGKYINTITRGARLKKFYIRSAASGVGKSRTMVADVCMIGCDQIYDTSRGQWVSTGVAMPTLFISTELELQEVQTMCLAFLSGVNEEHILSNRWDADEQARVSHAIDVLKRGKITVDVICDFGLKDIENSIRRAHRERGVQYLFFDYLMSTMKILGEITSQTGGVKLREDNVLFMISVRLKDLANELGIFVMTSTQLSAEWKTDPIPDQNLLRGSKSVADKADVGLILLDVTEKDLDQIAPLCSKTGVVPNVKMSVYKNRRGSYNRIFVWMVADKGTCRYDPVFVTDFMYRPIPVEDTVVMVEEPKKPEPKDYGYTDMEF